jgi:putative flippase GtrA
MIGKLSSPRFLFFRYLIVGGWNTLLSYGLYAILTWLLTGHVAKAYMVASLLNGFLSIHISFFSYRVFVFQAKGKLLQAYLRCCLVYGVGAIIYTLLLPFFVWGAEKLGGAGSAPYTGGAVLTIVYVLVIFFAHKHYSFRGHAAPPSPLP